MFFKIGVLKNFAIFIGKHLYWSLKFNFIIKKLQHRCFPVNIAKFYVFYWLVYVLPSKLSL